MIPVSGEPWDAWKQEHPETLVLDAGGGRLVPGDPFSSSRGRYVVGVVLGEQAKAITAAPAIIHFFMFFSLNRNSNGVGEKTNTPILVDIL